jgi:A/G-specific adenine glycosylase
VSSASRLVSWFRANARPLPWRTEPRDPYHTLVAESMAQQTRLDRVVPKFISFVARFPDLESLASATEDEVLELWSGLGYYRRARLLRRLALQVVATGGELPATAAELEQLPGVGPYTAAAVASMVFGEAVPLIDGNIARVGARVLAIDGDPRTGGGRKTILSWMSGLMEDASAGAINEGMMELGATVCTPTSPCCDACPMQRHCCAFRTGRADEIPPPRKTRAVVELQWVAAIAGTPDGRWLLRRVTEGPILRGLWLPPFADFDASRSAEPQAVGLLPVVISGPGVVSAPVRHSITHRRIDVVPVRVPVSEQHDIAGDWSWVDPRDPGLPTSSLLGKLVASCRS